MLRNPLYKGEASYNRTQQSDARRARGARGLKDVRPGNLRSRSFRPKEEWIAVRVPALVDPELWELAQTQLATNKERATRNNSKHDYLLRGLLTCGRCGRRMIGVWSRLGGGRYVCSVRYPRHAAWSCDGRSVSAAKVEPMVWEYVSELLSNSELLRARYEEGHGDPAIEERDEQERVRIERKLQSLEREIQRLIDAYQAGVIELTELQERRQRIEEHGQALSARVREIKQQRVEREQEIGFFPKCSRKHPQRKHSSFHASSLERIHSYGATN